MENFTAAIEAIIQGNITLKPASSSDFTRYKYITAAKEISTLFELNISMLRAEYNVRLQGIVMTHNLLAEKEKEHLSVISDLRAQLEEKDRQLARLTRSFNEAKLQGQNQAIQPGLT